jgi:hypothetical protein
MKNSLLTTSTGRRVLPIGRVYSTPGRNRRRADADWVSGKRPSMSVRRIGRNWYNSFANGGSSFTQNRFQIGVRLPIADSFSIRRHYMLQSANLPAGWNTNEILGISLVRHASALKPREALPLTAIDEGLLLNVTLNTTLGRWRPNIRMLTEGRFPQNRVASARFRFRPGMDYTLPLRMTRPPVVEVNNEFFIVPGTNSFASGGSFTQNRFQVGIRLPIADTFSIRPYYLLQSVNLPTGWVSSSVFGCGSSKLSSHQDVPSQTTIRHRRCASAKVQRQRAREIAMRISALSNLGRGINLRSQIHPTPGLPGQAASD